ncbi:hypothetical protein FRC06_005405 [Ceratobasidium sp. 370]|nr:hypothetical protein FRC06_005405 [Ceratobasidium sp. 370]
MSWPLAPETDLTNVGPLAAPLHSVIPHRALGMRRRRMTPARGTSAANAVICKRREQFRRHYQECSKNTPTDEQIEDARNLCKEAYAERVANGEVQEPIAPPPKRKRRGAVATISLSTPPEEYEEEDDMKQRETPPRYEPSYLGELSRVSNVTSSPNFYHDNSHLDEPAIGYTDAFESAYTSLQVPNYYAQPPPRYTLRGSSSPGHNFDHSIQLPRMDSPHYDVHGMGDHTMGHLNDRTRIPTTESFSTVHSSPGHAGHYSISTAHMSSSPHLIHSPHVTSPTPPHLMPVAGRQAVLFDQARDSPQLMYPQAGYGPIDPADRIPRGGLGTSHPQLQSRQYLQQYRHHPYACDRRGGPNGGARRDAYTGSPNEAGLPMVDNSYGGQSDPDSDSMPPLSLAGGRAARPMMGPLYEGGAPF